MKRILIILFILTLIHPSILLSQGRNIESGDTYFNKEQYKSSLTQYHKALRKNRLFHKSNKNKYIFLLFQIAESKRLLKDATCRKDYQNIADKYIMWALTDNMDPDTRTLLFFAESQMYLKEYNEAEGNYKQASENGDSIPDRFKLDYAYCSLLQNRFGQAIQILNEIKNKQKLEPSYSTYLQVSEKGLAKSITNNIQEKDTLTLSMTFGGCYGSNTHTYDLMKIENGYKVFVYKSQRDPENAKAEIDFVKTISESDYSAIVDLEKELRSHSQYTGAGWSTAWSSFALKTSKDNFDVETDYDAIGLGFDVEKLLNKK